MSDATIRALHVSPYFAPAFRYGGPPRSILGLCRALSSADVQVEVFTTTANGDHPLAPVPDGLRYEGVRVRRFALARPSFGWRASGLAAALTTAARGADLVHIHGLWNFTAWAGIRAARLAGIPYVISPRGMLQPEAMAHHRALKAVAYRLVEKTHLQNAALLHATSDAEARVLDAYGRNVASIPNGVEVTTASADDISRLRARLQIPSGADVVAFLGRIHPIKRLDLLADAFSRVRRAGRAATLVVAGPDDNGHRGRVEPLLRDFASDVRWAGALDRVDKWALLQTSRALVQCSDSESFGLSAAEAIASGVPVVVTDHGAWNHVQSIGAGYVTTHDARGIADALERLLTDPASARAMGERGRAWAARFLGWDAAARAIRAGYESAIAGRQPAAS
jgi:glycosyltransferase involved in cell wall biosynthesis